MKKRKYTLRERAARQQRTRERIVDAAMALHEQLGPADTTISAIAERAGVQRLTVYRHFPTDEVLFGACSSRYLALHPPPEPSAIGAEAPAEHTRAVLLALYRYYRDTATMWTGVYRDLDKVPALAPVMTGFDGYLAGVAEAMLAGWPRKSRRLAATLCHAVQFSTWQSLAREGVSDEVMADLVCGWASATTADRAGGRSKGARRPVTTGARA